MADDLSKVLLADLDALTKSAITGDVPNIPNARLQNLLQRGLITNQLFGYELTPAGREQLLAAYQAKQSRLG